MNLPTSKIALVTGASRGIGAAVALELASKGFRIALNYNHSETAAQEIARQIMSMGGQVLQLPCDVAQNPQVLDMFGKLDQIWGGLDVLVCNAGITRDTLLGASEVQEFSAVFDVNVMGVVNCCRQLHCAWHPNGAVAL